jgi:tetratricopeptide (TPR) repeat protein
MTLYCNYHPSQFAAYQCPKCGVNLCSNCIIRRKYEQYGQTKNVFICPKCNVYAKELSITNAIEPFWTRLPKFFKYPLSPKPIIMIFIISVLSSFFMGKNIVSALIQFACFGVVLTYSYSVLASTANGNLKPPLISLNTISDDFGIVFKQYAIYLIIALISIQLSIKISLFLGLTFLAISLLLLPAMIIMLAVTKSFFAAIMPQVFIRLAWRIGWPYLALCFFLMTLASAPVAILSLIWNVIPKNIVNFFVTFFSSYYMIVSYHLMGYILFQYHEQVGYKIDYDRNDEPIADSKTSIKATASINGRSENEMLNRINILIKEGNFDDAISLIREETHGKISDPIIAERYFNLLQLKKMKPELIEYGRNYIQFLSNTNQKDKLCEVYLLCKSIDENFINNDAACLYITAKALNEKNNHFEAKQAFERFIALDENHVMVPNAQFFIAKILNEKLNEPLKAIDIINNLIKKYPFHENTAYIQSYLRQIKT